MILSIYYKNSPFRETEVDILYGKGISRESDVLDLGVTQGVIEKSGSWYSIKGERIGQGRDTARQTLIDQPGLCQRIEADLRKSLGFGVERKEPEFELVPKKATAAS